VPIEEPKPNTFRREMGNEEIYRREMELSGSIVQINRHRSVEPFEWFGPDPEPQGPGKDCPCGGCETRRVTDGGLHSVANRRPRKGSSRRP
jgi:hypothetical protein